MRMFWGRIGRWSTRFMPREGMDGLVWALGLVWYGSIS
jgi:hypothetical protein